MVPVRGDQYFPLQAPLSITQQVLGIFRYSLLSIIPLVQSTRVGGPLQGNCLVALTPIALALG